MGCFTTCAAKITAGWFKYAEPAAESMQASGPRSRVRPEKSLPLPPPRKPPPAYGIFCVDGNRTASALLFPTAPLETAPPLEMHCP
mmetsp:Transcript_18034/g.53454  ORF Transcript_18034/g.53454 Transcript_18034/m.53454 type:complete len:86 (-) Transcript_18034:919-1176(-)